MRVMRGSFFFACWYFPCSSISLLSFTMVRNLKQVIFSLLSPQRSCLKNTGPFELNLMNNAIKGNKITPTVKKRVKKR